MAFKFPFTNYHELNLTWVLDQLKKLFEESAENVTVIENYNGRLTAVETELPLVSETAQGASQTAANAASLAQTAKSTADTAQENAIQAQGAAGQARQEAQAAQNAADAATQAAQQAQSVAQNFDGRITEAQNNASEALEASRSFENRVQAAITTANNAAQTATNAQGIATRADQNAALALDTLNAQRSELERIGAEQAALITEETENGKTEIENLAQSVLDSIPADYTALSNLVDKKAPVIINSASGSIASFDDGADDMKIQKLAVNIEPIQAGSGDPSPDNIRPLSGWTGAEIQRTDVNVWDEDGEIGDINTNNGQNKESSLRLRSKNYIPVKPSTTYYLCFDTSILNQVVTWTSLFFYDSAKAFIGVTNPRINGAFTTLNNAAFMRFVIPDSWGGIEYERGISINYPATDTQYHPYTGDQISVTFPDEAGTVYGAKMIINPDRTGTLVVTHRSATLTGAETFTWTKYGEQTLYTSNTVLPGATNTQAILGWCSAVGTLQNGDIDTTLLDKTSVTSPGIEFKKCLEYWGLPEVTGAALTAKLAEMNSIGKPFQIVYKLNDPVTIPLTAEQVSGILSTLYGTNNIWSDTGDTEVTYPADTKLYIDGKLAELQATILENI